MYIFKNAWLSIKRNKGRNLLIGLIILVISCASAVTLAIKSSAASLINSYKSQYQVEATIGVDRKNMMDQMKPEDKPDESNKTKREDMKNKFSNMSSITKDDIKLYGDSEYVSSYYYTDSIGVNSSNIEKATSTNTNDRRMPVENNSNFTLEGYSDINAMEEFINGKYKITSGEINSDFTSPSCVINSELATYNNLKVGDKIVVVDESNSKITYSLTISGIFGDNEESSDMKMFSNSANTIITNTNVIDNILKLDSSITQKFNPTYILKSSDNVDDFNKELHNKGLDEYLTVNTNLDEVESATKSISNLNTYATTFLVITLIIGVVVLLILNMIDIRERKYEIGVLRTIGMKKSLLCSQFVIELLIVAIISMALGTGIGSMISVPTSNYLLANEINSSKEDMQKVGNNFGQGDKKMPDRVQGIVKVDEVKSINAVVNFKVIMELLVIGVGITLVSSTVSMISIQRFSPLTILKERS